MIIDSHAHVMLPKDRQIDMMKQAGIDRTILFATTIHPETAQTMDDFSTELKNLYDILNGRKNPVQERIESITELAETIKSNPKKYIGFGPIPLGLSYEENLEWINNYILANNFKGIGELAPGSGQVGKLDPLFQASHESGDLPLWVHTFFPLNFADIKELLYLAQKYSTVPLIVGHLGGIHWLDTLKAVRSLPNIYLDLSATFTTIAPFFAIQEYPERTLFSSDAPYASPLATRTILEQIVHDKQILKEVLGGNIARLLDI
ncbi:amidohydrolase family protein [Pelosinus sp. sgz500959]|uniref:amidohydrolase family protein n=1 Tax=Pelosinus sp. sgz500959 TaxID=3242472 RepID=UPI0036710B7B